MPFKSSMTRKLMETFLSGVDFKPSPLMCAALRGESDNYIVREAIKRPTNRKIQ